MTPQEFQVWHEYIEKVDREQKEHDYHQGLQDLGLEPNCLASQFMRAVVLKLKELEDELRRLRPDL